MQLVVSDGHVSINVIATADSVRVESHEAVEATFLRNPDEAADAIRLAMQLTMERFSAPGAQQVHRY